MLHGRIRPIALMIVGACFWVGCQVPTAPYEQLPFDSRPRITNIVVEAPTPTTAPAPVNVTGTFFIDGITVTVQAPDAALQRFEGPAIQHLTGSSFEIELPLPVEGIYYFSVQSPRGLTSHTFELPVGN